MFHTEIVCLSVVFCPITKDSSGRLSCKRIPLNLNAVSILPWILWILPAMIFFNHCRLNNCINMYMFILKSTFKYLGFISKKKVCTYHYKLFKSIMKITLFHLECKTITNCQQRLINMSRCHSARHDIIEYTVE